MPDDRTIDELLDAGLKRYAQTEPLAGFEERVLAGLEGRELGTNRRMWWFWGAAVTATMALTMVIIMTRQQPVTQIPVETTRSVPKVSVPAQVAPNVVVKVTPRPVIRVVSPKVDPNPVVAQLVKRDVFPSPASLSNEEQMLLKYLKHTPFEELAANSRPDALPIQPVEMNQVLPGDATKVSVVNTK